MGVFPHYQKDFLMLIPEIDLVILGYILGISLISFSTIWGVKKALSLF